MIKNRSLDVMHLINTESLVSLNMTLMLMRREAMLRDVAIRHAASLRSYHSLSTDIC